MTQDVAIRVLAFVPDSMKSAMVLLDGAIGGHLKRCSSAEELVRSATEDRYSVAILPGNSLSSREWWPVWGAISSMEPRPSILVYALRSDFQMWRGVLDAGGHDVIVPPFTRSKLRSACESAYKDFLRRTAE